MKYIHIRPSPTVFIGIVSLICFALASAAMTAELTP
jgi:hypothetical protein